MAWTTPGTATAGEVLTAAFWNEQVRDNMTSIKSGVKNVFDKKTHTADVTVTYPTSAEVTTSLACTVAASVNDILIAGFSTLPATGTNIAHFNLMTKVGSTLTNRLQAPATFEPYLIAAANTFMVTGSTCYKVVSGDISGGNVVVTLVVNTAGASRKVVDGAVGATVWVMNIGQAIV